MTENLAYLQRRTESAVTDLLDIVDVGDVWPCWLHCWIFFVYVAEWSPNVAGRHNSTLNNGVLGQSPTVTTVVNMMIHCISEYSLQPDSMNSDHGNILVRWLHLLISATIIRSDEAYEREQCFGPHGASE